MKENWSTNSIFPGSTRLGRAPSRVQYLILNIEQGSIFTADSNPAASLRLPSIADTNTSAP